MSEENLAAICRLFRAVEERDLAGVLAAYDGKLCRVFVISLPAHCSIRHAV